MAIRVVWNYNILQEFQALDHCLQHFFFFFDTEFLGFLLVTPIFEKESIIYDDLRINVDSFKVIQLNITLSIEKFYFSGFDEKIDIHEPSFIIFLKNNGLNLDEIKENGIPIAKFSNKFIQVLRSNQGLRWVTFHGNYDLAYLFKLVTRKLMPSSALEFTKICEKIFRAIYDVKYTVHFRQELVDRGIRVERIPKIFKIEQCNGAHHTRSNSLVTSDIFHRMINCIINRCMIRPVIVMGRSVGRCPPIVMGNPMVRYFWPIVVFPRPYAVYDFAPIVVLVHQFF
ncbi:hypothetical protein UlMin_029983 [Ulmus minor]